MNHHPIIKKLVLSALLMSTVAAPAVTNAASVPEETNPTAVTQGTSAPAAKVLTISMSTASRLADPLELAKTYAPNTLEEWEKTLEQYRKIVGEKSGISFVTVMDKTNITPDQAYEILDQAIEVNLDEMIVESIAVPVEAGEASNQVFFSSEAVEVKEMAIEAEGSGLSSEADLAFAKARIALSVAAESKDATEIKEALNKLLAQYKQQIADYETAK